jgi:PAS domain S-box-containing protein
MIPLERVRPSVLNVRTQNGAPESVRDCPDDAKWAPYLAGGGEMDARIRAFDWSKTPLGPIGEWPMSLLEAVSLCLRSRFQLAVYWGPELVLLYNDAEREVLGAMHPRVLGMPAAEILIEMWDVVGPKPRGAPFPATRNHVTAALASPTSASGLYVAESTRWVPDFLEFDALAAGSPRSRETSNEASLGRDDRPEARTRPRVLVADHNADMRQYLGRLLAGAYDVDEVGDGRVALAAAREGLPDLVLADVMMPGLDGFGLLKELRADPWTRTLPVVLLSARAGEESRVEGLAVGADDYLVKPFGARELLARVGAQLDMARVRREAARRESELQAEVRKAQEQASVMLRSITDGFITLDSEWRFTHVNAKAELINGLRCEDHIGKTPWELFPAMRGTLLEREWRRAIAEQVAVEFENHYEPGDTWFHIKAYPSKGGGLSVFFHDITPRKRAEEALRKAHSELERRVRERTQELYRAHSRLGRQVAKRMRVEAERTELLRRLVRAQEDEHRRIARELHDDLTQRLAVLAIDAGTIEQWPGCPLEIGEKARGMRELLVALSESVHTLSRQMHPSILDDLGLVDTLRSECLSLTQRDGIVVKYDARDVPADLPRDATLCVYRVAQESLRNIVRHARSTRAYVRLRGTGRELVLCVRDRGVGFDVAARRERGLGLESMRERARLIHARLAVRSRPGEGTKVILRVPLHRRPR